MLDHLIEVIEPVLVVEVVGLASFYQTFELDAPIQLTLIFKAPVTNNIEWLCKILLPVFEECLASLKIISTVKHLRGVFYSGKRSLLLCLLATRIVSGFLRVSLGVLRCCYFGSAEFLIRS